MRFIIYGVGAIGGAIGAALRLKGEQVIGIARGAQLEAINTDGLLLRTPTINERVRFDCVASPADIDFESDDVVMLTMKTQDSAAALLALRDAGAETQPVLCVQNGVANETMAARYFPNVYGVTVMMPADYLVAGEVNVFSSPWLGMLEIGRFPSGTDAVVDAVCTALQRAGVGGVASEAVMEAKYGKLLSNLGNVVDAALGSGDRARFDGRLREEARAVYEAAGIAFRDLDATDLRRQEYLRMGEIAGVKRMGSSSKQSLARGVGSIETDYLNGEIVLLGRVHGVPTPLNAAVCRLARQLVSGQPGAVSAEELDRLFAQAA